MKELDLLKKDWKAQESSYPKLDKKALYQLIWKKSSSIVKWLYYISIGEFVFWTTLSLFAPDSAGLMKQIHIETFIYILSIINYGVLLYFIFLFYKNYKKVSFTTSSKVLITSILKVRRTVTQYVWFNIIMLSVSLMGGIFGMIQYGPESTAISELTGTKNEFVFWGLVALIAITVIGLAVGVLLLFYRIIYGILLKRLKNNYKELLKLES